MATRNSHSSANINRGEPKYFTKTREVKRRVNKPDDYLKGSLTSGERYTAWDNSEGYVRPDMGKDAGASIPYQAIKRRHDKAYDKYKVRNEDWIDPDKYNQPHWVRADRGDTVSEIAARYGMSWQQLWNYNLRNGVRPERTQRIMRRRGPHLIFKGSAFRIPAERWAAIQRRRN